MFSPFSRVAAIVSALFGAASIQAASSAHGHLPISSPRSRPRAERNAPRKRRSSSLWVGSARTQGQEMARRVRQIERGQLTMSNGLIVGFLYANSHGEMKVVA